MRRFLLGLTVVLIAFNTAVLITGDTYLYKAFFHNFANIDDWKIFHNRTIAARNPQPWAIGSDYNQKQLAADFEKQMGDWGTVAFLIIKNDSIRTEKYWEGYIDTTISGSFSMAKSIISILVGIALKEGKISSLDEPVAKYIPGFASSENDAKNKITIRHLLQMSSGLRWDESYSNPFAVTSEAYYGSGLKDLVTSLPAEVEPGATFNYQSCNSQLLGMVVKNATGKELSEYASEKLWSPIGAEHAALWSLDDKDGIEKVFCCFNSTARDFARLGKLYLQKGNWNSQQIVDTSYVEESIQPNAARIDDGSENKRYGLHWWCIQANGIPAFYARGILGQYIFVIPSHNMIIVRLGRKPGEFTADGHRTDIHRYIEEALKMYR